MFNEKAAKIYDYIRDCIQNHNFSPTVREICEQVGIRSTSTVHYYLKAREDEGLILKDPRKTRTIKLPMSSMTVPLLGTVTAGQPITAIEEIEEYIPVANLPGNSTDYFALHVRGESMRDAGILNGDIVIVRKTRSCQNGDIVVALMEDEATVKRFFREKDHFRLQPENPDFEPIRVRELTILGKVAALLRNY